MSRIRAKLSFANVVAVVALFAALTGGALAASNAFVGLNGRIQGCVERGVLHVVKAGHRCPAHSTALAFDQKGPAGAAGKNGLSSGPAGGSLTGTYPNPGLGSQVVTGTYCAVSGVHAHCTPGTIVQGSITGQDIANGTIYASNLAGADVSVPLASIGSVASGTCNSASIPVSGVPDGDSVVSIASPADGSLLVAATGPTGTGTVPVKVCNPGSAAASSSDSVQALLLSP